MKNTQTETGKKLRVSLAKLVSEKYLGREK